MPSLGADMDEGTLLEWLVKPGDEVRKGEVIAVVDTDKAAIEVESFAAGTVERLIVNPGETVPVGTVLATIACGTRPRTQPAAAKKPAAAGKAAAARKPRGAKKAAAAGRSSAAKTAAARPAEAAGITGTRRPGLRWSGIWPRNLASILSWCTALATAARSPAPT